MNLARYALDAGMVFAGLVGIFFLAWIIGTDAPAVDVQQTGYRGTGMQVVTADAAIEALEAANQAPEPIYDLAEGDLEGPRASEVYENVQVLGHLSQAQFDRLMVQITEWVSPEQGCEYCHNAENLADDGPYTKNVSRRMFQMTMNLNDGWDAHVAPTGVTCYTCHRGQNIPANVWASDPGPRSAQGAAGWRRGQNTPAENVGLTSLDYDPFTDLLMGDEQIQIGNYTALPTSEIMSMQGTERTYALMIHFSESLGVNCTYCHNTNNFASWQMSPIAAKASLGIQMVREMNNEYIGSLTDMVPDHRKGPMGDILKSNCLTCHAGVNKPLYGANMLDAFPSLASYPDGADIWPPEDYDPEAAAAEAAAAAEEAEAAEAAAEEAEAEALETEEAVTAAEEAAEAGDTAAQTDIDALRAAAEAATAAAEAARAAAEQAAAAAEQAAEAARQALESVGVAAE